MVGSNWKANQILAPMKSTTPQRKQPNSTVFPSIAGWGSKADHGKTSRGNRSSNNPKAQKHQHRGHIN